ncbi:Hin recombinase [Collimonas pratensis]|uniref:helix-turn-helix domain-containing protein n=1 Tax=Collimonas pratensis TaxID=279113 RepID=UPI00143CD103|nr:helix-turn-helix domain-containing protein [Collimonas pratensis]NKI68947.1 Hin recombinase [Collimonas pratensis]
MGRPSKLTDAQWEQIGKRLLANESASSLAREFGVSKGAISIRFSKRIETVKTVANQIVSADRALSLLNVSEQIAVHSLVDDIKAMSTHLAGAGKFGAATAHRLAGIANAKVAAIDDIDPLSEDSMIALKGIAVMTRMANESSEIAVNLLRANKETVDEINKRSENKAPSGLKHFYGDSGE